MKFKHKGNPKNILNVRNLKAKMLDSKNKFLKILIKPAS